MRDAYSTEMLARSGKMVSMRQAAATMKQSPLDETVIAHIQRSRPFGMLDAPRVLTLPLDRIQPVIRIAHRQPGAIDIAERIIFDHELVLILAGRGELVVGRQRYPYGAHDLLFIPPFTPHGFVSNGGTEGEHIAVHFDFAPDFPSFSENPDRRPPYKVHLTHPRQLPPFLSLGPGHRIEAAFGDLLRERAAGDALGTLAAASHLTGIVIAMLRLAERSTSNTAISPFQARNQSRVTAVIAHLRDHFAEPLAASDLAEVAGVSQSRLNVLFQQMTGYAPVEYLRRVRVEEARRLLGDIDLSVKEIAARTGFEDAYHFSKVFRRIDGLSPTDYRAALLAGISHGARESAIK
jgi:AraC-like DNA-binding protein